MIATPNEILYFVEVAHTLNFSRASERIGISQPSLSTAIKRLEQSIGAPLFIRNKKGVTLTKAGKRLLSHAKQLLQLWETVKSASLASHHEVQGTITLGCHQSVGLFILPAILPGILSEYPKLEIQLKHDLSRKILENVINLSIDIGLIVNPTKHPDLILQKLYDDRVTFWQAVDMKVSPTTLICDPSLIQTQRLLKRIGKSDFQFQRIITCSNLEMIANLTSQGCGIGILPGGVAASCGVKKIKVMPNMPAYQDEIYLVYRHENREIKAVQTIVQAIKQHFKKNKTVIS